MPGEVFEEVPLEVQAVYPGSAWAVGGFPSDPYALQVVDPSLCRSWRHSDRHDGDSISIAPKVASIS